MSGVTAANLSAALSAWATWTAGQPDAATRLLRQPGHFLVHPSPLPRFSPIRFLIAHCFGTPFSQKGGRSINMADFLNPLTEMGLAHVTPETPFFEAIFIEWAQACLATGKPLANYIGDDPRTGRVFWVCPAPFI